MKKIVLIAITLISLQSCSQNQKQIMQNPNITANNIVEEITKQVKHYPQEPMYVITHLDNFCHYEIFIDDNVAYKEFDGLSPDAFNINQFIYKKGIHSIKYKLYPLGEKNKYDTDFSTLTDDLHFELKLESYDIKNEESSTKLYKEYVVPKIKEEVAKDYFKEKFAGAGKTYYEGSFDINVDVPYELHPPFENAQDLRRMDKKILEAKLVKEYNKIRNIYQIKNKDDIARLMFDKVKNQMITEFASPEKIKAMWDEVNKIFFESDTEILPIANYEVRFFSEGKLVALYSDGSNPSLKGDNALVCNLKSGYGKGYLELKHLFYIPQGETEFKVY